MFGNYPWCQFGGQSTQRSQLGSQILTPVMKQGPLFPWKSMEVHVHTCEGEPWALNHIPVTAKSWNPPYSLSCYVPLRAIYSYLYRKIPANHLYLNCSHQEGLGCNEWTIRIKESASLPGTEGQMRLLDPLRICTLYYKPVLQIEPKSNRKSCIATVTENSEQMLGLTGMQAKQTSGAGWTDSPVTRQEQFRLDSELSSEPGRQFRIMNLILPRGTVIIKN